MKIFLFHLVLWFCVTLQSQNKQVLYNFAGLPQSLLLNPSSEVDNNLFIGIPLLSGISGEIGASGFVLSDIFENDGIDINDKIGEVSGQLTYRDFVKIYAQEEVVSVGFRVNNRTDISFGFYTEIDALVYHPKDVFTLINEGNSAYLNKSFLFSQILFEADLLGALHFGVSSKITEKLTLGGRFKVYSSAVNIRSKNNTGSFATIKGKKNKYKHILSDISINAKSSGLVTDEKLVENFGDYLQNVFFGGNLGIGFDLGFTYRPNGRLEFSGSVLDIGFINHTKEVLNYSAEGSFSFEGVDFQFDPNINYLGDMQATFAKELVIAENKNSYISWRPIKMNAAFMIRFGNKVSKKIGGYFKKDSYTDAAGVQLYSVYRPISPHVAFTAFYQKSVTNKIHTKVTYTVDNFSYSNIGAGVSVQFGCVNMYSVIDNILGYRNLSAANNISLQVGINLIFN
jgi:hypothetical protein